MEEEEESTSSPLCNRLFQLWAQGRLSATQVAEIAHLTMLEGCQSKEILQLAKSGTLKTANVAAGLLHLQWFLSATCNPALALGSLRALASSWPCSSVQPYLYENSLCFHQKPSENYVYSFGNLFCIPECQTFWKEVEKFKIPGLLNHLQKVGRSNHLKKQFHSLSMAMAVNFRTGIH